MDEQIENVEAMVKPLKNAKVRKLDISLDLESQGVIPGHYDVVIGPPELSGAQKFARLTSLLAPGGRIFWESSTQPDLPALRNAGMTGIEFSITRTEGTVFAASVLQNAPDTASEAMLREVQLVYRKKPTSIFPFIQKALESTGWRTTSAGLLECQTKVGDRVVMLADLEGPLLSILQDGELAAVQCISNTASSILG